jgi:hypothetical protein
MVTCGKCHNEGHTARSKTCPLHTSAAVPSNFNRGQTGDADSDAGESDGSVGNEGAFEDEEDDSDEEVEGAPPLRAQYDWEEVIIGQIPQLLRRSSVRQGGGGDQLTDGPIVPNFRGYHVAGPNLPRMVELREINFFTLLFLQTIQVDLTRFLLTFPSLQVFCMITGVCKPVDLLTTSLFQVVAFRTPSHVAVLV